MSKSKLNRRQYKKISKTALLACSELGLVNLDDVEMSTCDGDYYVPCEDPEEEWTALGMIGSEFYWSLPCSKCDEQGYPIQDIPKGYRSLSFANRVHYTINFLEGKQ